MTDKKQNEKVNELEKENAQLKEQIAGLTKRVEELAQKTPKPSKSRTQAEEGLKMLQQGPCTVAQFKTLNEKYPSDVPYYIRTLLKIDVKTVRLGEGKGSAYMLPEHYVAYQEGLAKQKAAEKTAGAEAKEEIQKAEAPVEAAAV